MLKLFGKPKEPGHQAARPTHCPDCGCALTDPHWRSCPRCQKELETACGCGGCGACGK